MGPATEVLFGMISSAIDNWLSNFLEEKGKAIIGKVKLGIFRLEITADLQEYINSHDVFVLTNDAFEVFLSKYNVVESIISSALDSSVPDYKEKFIKEKIKQFCMSGTTNRQVSPEDEQQIYNIALKQGANSDVLEEALKRVYDLIDPINTERFENYANAQTSLRKFEIDTAKQIMQENKK